MALKPLRIVLSAIDRATAPMRKLQRTVNQLGSDARKVGQTMTVGLTLPIVGAGVGSVRAATNFDTSLSRIVGLVGESREQVDAWRQDLLKIGPAVGKGPGELAEALFFVTSAGVKGQDAIDVLTASAQAASAGLGETSVVADAVTSVMNAYGQENVNAADATGILVATIRAAKTDAASLAPVLGRVIPVASQMGVGFDEVGASIAAMTKLGSSADEAATSLQATLSSLLKPTEKTQKVFKAVGLSAGGLREQLREKGLLSVLETLKERFQGDSAAMAAAFPNVRALRGVLALVGKNADQARQVFEELGLASKKDLGDAFGEFASRPGFKFQQAMAQINATMIIFGDAVLPVVVPIVQDLTASVASVAQWFSNLSPAVKTVTIVIGGLVAVVGPMLAAFGFAVQGFAALLPILALVKVAFASLTAVMLANPIVAIVAGVAALIGLGVVLFKKWGFFRDLVNEIFEKIKGLGSLISQSVKGFFGFGGEEKAIAQRAAITPGLSPSPITTRSEVGGAISLEIESQTPVRVKKIEPAGGIDLDVETGLSMAF